MRNIQKNETGEVLGEFILEILNVLHNREKETVKIFQKYGFQEPKRIEWYPFKDWIKGFNEISKEIGPTKLFIVGVEVSENFENPIVVNSLKNAFESLIKIYHRTHRNTEFGKFKLLNFDDAKREAEIMSDAPYPCDFERGVVMGIVNKHKPYDSRNIWVVHKDLRECRKKGLESCKYFIKW